MFSQITKKYPVTNYFISILCFFFVACYITYPLIFNMGSLATGRGDELYITWVLNFIEHQIFTDPLHLFNANIFFPYSNTLLYSDPFITSALVSLLPTKIVGEPFVATNFMYISSLTLIGFTTWAFVYQITKEYFAGFLAGLLLVFSPVVLDKSVHLQILSIWFVPLSLLTLITFCKRKRLIFLILSCGLFVCQIYNSILPGYFIILFNGFYLLFSEKLYLLKGKQSLIVISITVLLVLPLLIAYYSISRQFHYVRDFRDTIHFAIQPEDLYYPSNYTRLKPLLTPISRNSSYPSNAEYKPAYLGLIFSLLSLIVLVHVFRTRRKLDILSKTLIYTGLIGFIFSFGPFLHIGRRTVHHPFPIPLPYIIAYYLVPGLKAVRNVARWEMLFVLSMAILIGLQWKTILKKISKKRRYFVGIIVLFGIVAEYNFPMYFERIPKKEDFPKEEFFLATLPENTPVIHMPIYVWNIQPYSSAELMRQYYSVSNFQPMVNGGSGYSPKPWEDMAMNLLSTFPDSSSIRRMKSIGVKYILVHKDEYDHMAYNNVRINNRKILSGDLVITTLNHSKEVSFVRQFATTYIYEIR